MPTYALEIRVGRSCRKVGESVRRTCVIFWFFACSKYRYSISFEIEYSFNSVGNNQVENRLIRCLFMISSFINFILCYQQIANAMCLIGGFR